MNQEDQKLFTLLKREISTTFLAQQDAPSDIRNWKGQEISAFREDLFNKVKSTISEKWFYTYMKNDISKLPRIDTLNMLSRYAGYKNWNNFKSSHKNDVRSIGKKNILKNYFWLPILVALFFALYKLNVKNEFNFCFIDEVNNESIKTHLDIKILQLNESPIFLKTDSSGCFSYRTKINTLHFVVQSPYYKTDTIIRSIDKNRTGTIKLNTDDYTLMLHYYANGNVKDWKKHRNKLRNMISDDAQIYQVYPLNMGIEFFTKDEFINKLTTPTSSLRNIRILDKSFKNGKIVKLKFMTK